MITVDELKAELNIEADEDTDDELIAQLEREAVAIAQNRTGLYLGAPASLVVVLPGSGTNRLWLSQEPIGAAAVLELPSVGHAGTAIVEADDNGFVVRGAQLLRKNGHVWTKGYEYQVTLTQGWEDEDLPDSLADLRGAVKQLVVHKYTNRGVVADDRARTEELPFGVKDVFDSYRVPVIA